MSIEIDEKIIIKVCGSLSHFRRMVAMIILMVVPLLSFCSSRDDINRKIKILADSACTFYNNRQADKLKTCSSQVDELLKRTEIYPDDYFTIKYYESLRNAWDGHYTEAIAEAKRLYRKAEISKNKMGTILFNELMGLLYEMMEQMDESQIYLNRAARMSLKYYPYHYYNNTQYLFSLIEVQLELQPISRAFSTIKYVERLIDRVQNGDYGSYDGFDINRNRRLLCSYYMAYYNRIRNYYMTAKYMEMAAKYKPDDWYVNFNINVESSKYYKAVHNYPLALQKINSAIAVDDTSSVKLLMEKADLLSLKGEKDASLKLYRLCCVLQKNERRQQFDKEVAGLQNMYYNMRLQLNLKQIQMEKEIMSRRMITIVAILLFAAFACMTAFNIYRGRVSKQLKRDKATMAETSEALKKALIGADESNKLKNSFIHNISHEIRTPLNSIVGYSDIIASQTENLPEFKVFSDCIGKSAAELLAIINNMVDLSIYQSDDLSDFEKVDLNLYSLCQESIKFLKLSGKLNDNVIVSFSGNPEELVLHTSPQFIKRILNHLLINAAKYTSEGNIRIAYTLDNEEHRVIFSVTDTGIGINPECYDSIFESFEKAGSFVQGMGLGLTICRTLIHKLGGEIYVDHEYKDGARFIFTH